MKTILNGMAIFLRNLVGRAGGHARQGDIKEGERGEEKERRGVEGNSWVKPPPC